MSFYSVVVRFSFSYRVLLRRNSSNAEGSNSTDSLRDESISVPAESSIVMESYTGAGAGSSLGQNCLIAMIEE